MLKIIFEKSKIISLFVWSFFSFSLIKCLSIFYYETSLYQALICSFLFFIYFFIFKNRFGTRLTFFQYMISDLLFIIGITILSYCYYKLVMLENDHFNFAFFIALLIASLVFTSLLFMLTLIKRK